MTINGATELAGGLISTFANGFVPVAGQNLRIMNLLSYTGIIDDALMPGFTDDRFMRVEYGPTDVILVVDSLGSVLGFSELSTASLAGGPTGSDTGDMDGDGNLDVVVTFPSGMSGTPGSLNTLPSAGTDMGGNGLGFFNLPSIIIPIDPGPIDIDPADIDNDQDLDILTANLAGDSVSILLNDGMGGYAPAVDLPWATSPARWGSGILTTMAIWTWWWSSQTNWARRR